MPGNICIVCEKNLILDEEEVCAHCELTNDVKDVEAPENHDNLNCGSCNVHVTEDSESLFCDVCDRWFHNACCENPLLEELYCQLNDAPNNVKWFCDKCIWITEKWIKSFPTITLNERRGKSRRMKTAVNSFKSLIETDPEYDFTKEPEVKIEVENDDVPDVPFDNDDRHSTYSEEYGETKKVKKKRKIRRAPNDNKERIYKCQFCENSFHQQMLLNRHQRRVHAGLEPFECTECDKKFFRESKLKIHDRTHTGKKPFPCSICDKSFSREGWLEKHQIEHTGEKPFQCRACKLCFDQQDELKEHRKTHIGDQIHQCSHCGQTFARLRKLKIHERLHTGERPYKCNYCEKCFGSPEACKKHERTHSESKIYQCSHCGKSFARQDHMKKHEIIHTGEKPHQCSYCGKAFHRKDHLRNHERSHTEEKPAEKPHQCSYCGKAFQRKDHLKKHEKYHTGEKPHQCDYCGKEFVRLDNLKAHERIHTGEKSTPRSRTISSTTIKSEEQPTSWNSNKSQITTLPIFTKPNSIINEPTNSMSESSRTSMSSHNPTMSSSSPYTIPMPSSPFLQSRPILNTPSNHHSPHFNPLHQMPIHLMSNQQLSHIEGWNNVGRWVNSGNWGNYEDSN